MWPPLAEPTRRGGAGLNRPWDWFFNPAELRMPTSARRVVVVVRTWFLVAFDLTMTPPTPQDCGIHTQCPHLPTHIIVDTTMHFSNINLLFLNVVIILHPTGIHLLHAVFPKSLRPHHTMSHFAPPLAQTYWPLYFYDCTLFGANSHGCGSSNFSLFPFLDTCSWPWHVHPVCQINDNEWNPSTIIGWLLQSFEVTQHQDYGWSDVVVVASVVVHLFLTEYSCTEFFGIFPNY